MTLRLLTLAIAGASVLLASGCRTVLGNCHEKQPYESAEDRPPLRMPVGLEAPDTAEALKIPAITEPEAPVDPDGPCVDAPPAITAPPLPATPEYDNVRPDGTLRPRRETADGDADPEEEESGRKRRRPPSRPR